MLFFNKEDISKVWFEGYIDNQEKSVQQLFEKEQKNIKYPHLTLDKL